MPTPPLVPKVEKIRLAIITILGTVQTQGQSGNLTGLTVEDVNQFFNGGADLSCAVAGPLDEWIEEPLRASAVGQDTYDQEIIVAVRIQCAAGGLGFSPRANYIQADVRAAIMTAFVLGQSGSGALAGLVENVKPHGMTQKGFETFSDDGGNAAGITIPFTVRYRTTVNNPYA